MSARVVTWVVMVGLAWGVGAPPARACSYGNAFIGARPPDHSTLPSGEVYVALLYAFSPGALDHFRVANADGDDIPVTAVSVGDAVLLHFDPTGAEEVSIFGSLGQGGDGLLVSYEVSLDAPDLSVPALPVVAVGETTCEACPEPRDSCCSRPDTDGRLSTSVNILTTQGGMILGWTNDGEHLAGVLTQTTYESMPAYAGPGTRLSPGADIVAMSVAGVMSSSVTWPLGDTGPCQVEYPTPTVKEGCVASPGGSGKAPGMAFAVGFLLLFARRRRVLGR